MGLLLIKLIAKFAVLLLIGIVWMIHSDRETQRLNCRGEELKRQWDKLKKQ